MPNIRHVPVTLSQADFLKQVEAFGEYKSYKNVVGVAGAQGWAVGRYAIEAFRSAGTTVDHEHAWPVLPATALATFKDNAGRKAFVDGTQPILELEMRLIKGRQDYLDKLATDAKAGRLRASLNSNTVPDATSQVWTELNVQQKIKAWPPPQPATSSSPNNATGRAKAKVWVSQKSPESARLVDAYAKTSGGWPLGHDTTMLQKIWTTLVPSAGLFRPTNFSGVKYPSSVGGFVLLQKVMTDFGGRRVPGRGDAAWEDWALYLFAAIMTTQGFTDGNKRVARLAYAIMIASGAVDFRAMTDNFGSRLASM